MTQKKLNCMHQTRDKAYQFMVHEGEMAKCLSTLTLLILSLSFCSCKISSNYYQEDGDDNKNKNTVSNEELNIKEIWKVVRDQARQLNDLTDTLEDKNNRILELEKTVTTQGDEIIHLKKRLEHLTSGESTKVKLQSELKQDDILHVPVNKTERGKSILKHHPLNHAMVNQDANRVRRQASGISFSAYLSHDVDLSMHQVLRFDQIITNEGSGYNKHTGAFVCPEAGVYLLTFTVGDRGIKESWSHLVVNSVNVIDGAVDTQHLYQDLQGGNTVIMRLQTGDTVMIEHLDTDVGHVEGSFGFRLTSFSGVLLYV